MVDRKQFFFSLSRTDTKYLVTPDNNELKKKSFVGKQFFFLTKFVGVRHRSIIPRTHCERITFLAPDDLEILLSEHYRVAG